MNTVENLPTRSGERPETSKEGPHSQRTQNASPSIWGELVAKAFAIEGVTQGHSRVSMADSMAGLVLGLPKEHGAWSLATDGPIEAFHIHGVTDTSIHAVLPTERAKEVIEKGWGEPHTYADFDTQIMLYAPRNQEETKIIVALLTESVEFSTDSVL
jgi:phospholipase/carboxylesterase